MKYSVNIEKPCSQDWNLMKDNYGGKFCSACQKSVVDYSQLSDKEVLRVLKQNNFKGCGRFSQKQLNKPFTEKANRISFLPFFKVFSGLLLFGTAEKALARQPKPETFISERKELSSRSNFQKYSVKKDSIKIVKGAVISSEDNIGLPGAIISIEGTKKQTQTDLDGNFSIEIPEYLSNEESITLAFYFLGFEPQQVEINPNKIPLEVKVKFTEDYLIGVVVIENRRHWWQFWKKRYRYN